MRIPNLCVLFTSVLWLSSCVPETAISPTIDDLTIPVSPTYTEGPTLILPPTLTPLQAGEKIKSYLQTTADCSAPCFWGITPKQTTFIEAKNIFASLGLEPQHTLTQNNQEFYDTDYDLEKELDLSIVLTVQDSITKTLSIGMNIYTEGGTPRKWSAYSPEKLIQRYGSPSKVEFFLGRVTPTPSHSMVLYFDNVDLIVSYSGMNNFLDSNTLEICPLINEVNFIKIWLGDEPRHPPPTGVPLELATLLNIEEFSKLMMGDNDKACFNLKDESFP